MKNSKLTFKMLLIVAAFLSSVNFAFAWTYTASGPWAYFIFPDGWKVEQCAWGAQNDQTCQLYANSSGNFACYVNYTGGGIKNYCHTSKNIDIPISSSYYCTANFNISVPNNPWFNFMFDLWTGGNQDELIVSEYWNGDGIWGNVVASNVTIGGTSFREVRRANNGSNNVLIFTPYNKRTSGSQDLMALFIWSKDRGLLVNSSTFHGICFGVEVTSTNGWQQFTCNSFSASWGSYGNGNSGNVSIQNRATGLFIDGMGRTSNGSNAGQWSGSGSNAQKWTMETSGSNVKFKNVATGLYLDGMGRTSNGSLVGQYGGGGSSNQLWAVETYGNYKRIRNIGTGLYIDGMYWSSNGSNLGQWGGGGSDAQQWTITSLKSAEANSDELSTTDKGNTDIALFPNPFTYEASLKIENPEQVTSIVVYDMLGKPVEIIDHAGVKNVQTIGSLLRAGMYVVKVHSADNTQSVKIIKR